MTAKKEIYYGSLPMVINWMNGALSRLLGNTVNLILKLLLEKETMEACISSVFSMTRSLEREGQTTKS